jgi:hypothetical protein
MKAARSLVAIIICALALVAVAQEDTADPDNSYIELRRSKDRATQLTAERYLNLVKLQEWSDFNGKFKARAKYIAHDPDLQWVRLEVVRGSGKDRAVGEVQVPVDKLSRACQSRVRQIARLQPRLDELAAAEAEEDEENDAEGGRLAAYDERGGEQPLEAYGAELSDDQSAIERGIEQPVDLGRESLPSSGDWRTSYDAFRENISIGMGRDGQPTVEWGGLAELRTLSEALATPAFESRYAPDASGRQQIIAEATSQLGEVSWEAPLIAISPGLLGVKASFQVVPPAPPATVQFLVADNANIERWMQLPPGQPVRFHGRLGLISPQSIVVWIKMTDEQAAAIAPLEGERDPSRQLAPREYGQEVPRR